MTKNSIIAQLGEPVLRQRAQSVTEPLGDEVSTLVDILINIAIANKGVGIAAPQIHQSHRIFIIASHPSDRYPYAPNMPPTAMINPRILSHGVEVVKDWEGCLSVPNVRGLVPRYKEITVEYTTQTGEIKQDILTDFVARIFQHELDHLDGIVFTDRIEDEADLYTESEWRSFIAS